MCGCRRAVLSERALSSLTVSSADLVLKGHMTNIFSFFFFTPARVFGVVDKHFPKAGRKKSKQVILLGRCILKKSGLIPLELRLIEMLIS